MLGQKRSKKLSFITGYEKRQSHYPLSLVNSPVEIGMDDENSLQSVDSDLYAYSLNRWMTDLHSSIKHLTLGELSLASAHNSGMDYEAAHSNSYITCQDKSFRHQLDNGVRVLDIRLKWFAGYGDVNRGLLFTHNLQSGRTFADMLNDLNRFHEANPGEIVILDFHAFYVQRDDRPVPYAAIHAHFMRHYTGRMLPRSARELTLEQIKARYPGRNMIVAVPPEVYEGGARDYTYFWTKIKHQWVGDGAVSAERLYGHIAGVMNNPPFNDVPWSMTATTYSTAGGPGSIISTLRQWYPVGGDWQRKSNIINFDFVTRESAAFIRHCIESNIGKPVRPRLAILRPSEGEIVFGPRLTVAGVGTPGALVTLSGENEGGIEYGAGVVDNEGTWEISVVTPPQVYELSCWQKLNGHGSHWTSPITIRYVGTLLSPEIRSPANGSMVGNRKPDINGWGAVADASVEFYDTKEPPTYYGSARVDSNGSWFGKAEADLPGQAFSLRCLQRLAGVTSPFSEPVTFTFMNPPTILAPSDGSEYVSVTTLIRGEGALPGATVWFHRSGDFILDYGRAVADENGQWSGFNSRQFPLGQFSLACRQTLNGVGSEPASVTFNVGIPAPSILEPSEGSTVTTPRPLISGNGALPGATVVFYRSGTSSPVYGSAAAGADGAWIGNTIIDLTGPQFSLSCVQQLNGVRSEPSTPVTFNLGIPAPRILMPIDGSTVETPKPWISGEGKPGATVLFYKSGTSTPLYGQATVGVDGQWGGEPSISFPGRLFSLVCIQRLEGVTSSFSEPTRLTINLPLMPKILTPAYNSQVTAIPLISGEDGILGARVHFFEIRDGSLIPCGQVDVNADGRWASFSATTFPPGKVTLTCYQVLNGIRSAYCPSITFNVLDKPLPPKDLTVVPGMVSAKFEWQNSSPGVVSSQYYIGNDASPISSLQNSVVIDSLNSDETYTFYVRSVAWDLKLSDYASITFKTSSGGGSEPVNFRITANGNRRVSFAWDLPVEGADNVTGYVFKVFVVEFETQLGTTRTFTLQNLTPLIPIVVGVRCKFVNGTESDWVTLPVLPQP
ncbi:hypothetical protein D3C73_595810 [compost metagenome]